MINNVAELLIRTAERFPKKTAVADSKQSITFQELVESAKKISSVIRKMTEKGSPIGVYLPKSCDMLRSFAGISMSGNFYVPLDTKSPQSRVATILDTVGADIVITDKEHEASLQSIFSKDVILIDSILESTDIDTSSFYETAQIDTDPVYSIFTSGSTGIPKGVVISHRGVIDYISSVIEAFHFDETANIGNQAQFYFDLSVMDIYLMYATGATLFLIPDNCFTFPSKLVDYLDENKISLVSWVPSAFVNIANLKLLEVKKPKYLKDIMFCGEVMPNRHLNHWRKNLPDCRYVNQYGPTEITCACTYYEIDRAFTDDEPLPIGKPYRNSEIIILKDRKTLAARGEEGELCVRGSSVAMGYYNNPEKTAASFIVNPARKGYPEIIYCTGDIVYENERGELMYVGRVDSQIKHNGYRIELGEIENAVLGIKEIDNCCACYDFINKKIVLYFQSDEELDMVSVKKQIMTAIPRYMVPSEFIREEKLKSNSNGKIDRAYYNSLRKKN